MRFMQIPLRENPGYERSFVFSWGHYRGAMQRVAAVETRLKTRLSRRRSERLALGSRQRHRTHRSLSAGTQVRVIRPQPGVAIGSELERAVGVEQIGHQSQSRGGAVRQREGTHRLVDDAKAAA